VCSDQEAVELIRNIGDPQEASKTLVDYALSRSSTDNLSCMVVRFDCNLTRDVVERRSDPIGIEGGLGEADKNLGDSAKQLVNVDVSKEEPGLDVEAKDDELPLEFVESLSHDVSAIGDGEVSKLDVENKTRHSKDEKRSSTTI
jgi:hypothetical protein